MVLQESGVIFPPMQADVSLPLATTSPLVPNERKAVRDAAWARPALIALLGLTALLYLWDLGASGWANAYYSAAVQAGITGLAGDALRLASTHANAITVDKTPAALWVMDLSARIFGVNAWSILAPQALMGVTAVWLLFLTVRRHARAGGRSDRRRRAGADPGRHADVPLQQPGRSPGAAVGRRGLRDRASPGARVNALDRPRGRAHRLRLPGEDAPGVPGHPRLRRRVSAGGPHHSATTGLAGGRGRARGHRLRRLVRGAGRALAGGPASLYRRLTDEQPAWS